MQRPSGHELAWAVRIIIRIIGFMEPGAVARHAKLLQPIRYPLSSDKKTDTAGLLPPDRAGQGIPE